MKNYNFSNTILKKILKVIFYFFLLIFTIGFYQATEYDNKYVNRQSIQIDFNTIRTPAIKRIFLKIEKSLNLIFYDNKKENSKKNLSLPKYKYIKSNLQNIISEDRSISESLEEEWFRSNKNNFSQRFSKLKQINKDNVNDLKIAWIYRSKDGEGQIQSNPIIVKDKVITPTPGHHIVAIDSKNGNEIWKFKSKSSFPAQRGLVYWEGNDFSRPGIFFSDHSGLYKLNIENGKLDKSFGKNGFIKTKLSKTAPIIFDNNLIISTFSPSIDVYDVNNGKIK